jgi:hypothetical protein
MRQSHAVSKPNSLDLPRKFAELAPMSDVSTEVISARIHRRSESSCDYGTDFLRLVQWDLWMQLNPEEILRYNNYAADVPDWIRNMQRRTVRRVVAYQCETSWPIVL